MTLLRLDIYFAKKIKPTKVGLVYGGLDIVIIAI